MEVQCLTIQKKRILAYTTQKQFSQTFSLQLQSIILSPMLQSIRLQSKDL